MKQNGHKATIETLINTTAIAISTFGVTRIMEQNYYGFLVVIFAMLLEFIKYYGRTRGLW